MRSGRSKTIAAATAAALIAGLITGLAPLVFALRGARVGTSSS